MSHMNHNYIVRQDSFNPNSAPVRIEYYNPFDGRRVVSQTCIQSSLQVPSQICRINCEVASSLPQIALKKEDNQRNRFNNEVVLVNGSWDVSNKIPKIVAEMHGNTEDFLQNSTGRGLNESRDFTNPSPRSSDSGIESDCTDGNLSWLLNYKIQELPPVPDSSTQENIYENSLLTTSPHIPDSAFQQRLVQVEVPSITDDTCAKETRVNGGQSYRYSGPKKPPFTYTELIECALREKGELTVSGIYHWISENFPFYKQNDDRWKNSVRHNLSINPHFRKGGKAIQGAGHLWTMAQKDDQRSIQIRERMTQFIQDTFRDAKVREQEAFDRELQAATESILGEINSQTGIDPVGNGTKIEVEYINLEGPHGLEDFLTPPVSKQEIVDECGLGSDFFITDINPNSLGLNLTESEVASEDKMYEDVLEYYHLKN